MAFIVKKKIKGRDYFYLQENQRVGNKVKTKTIAYLGKNKREALRKSKEILEMLKTEDSYKKQETGDKSELERKSVSVDELAIFCKRKGFVYQSGEIYGGLAGFWDFGPLGVELKNNIKREWWNFHVTKREDIIGIDGSLITHPSVWKASGHVEKFVEFVFVCEKCGNKIKVDKQDFEKIKSCSICGGKFENKGEINLMFPLYIGPISQDSIKSYLRPETAQLIFINFKNVYETSRMSLPFGIAQIGKAFRNEVSPRDFLFRLREFEQMEIEYFVSPKDEKCPYKIPEIEILIYSSEDQEKGLDPKKMRISEAVKSKIIKKDWHAYWLGLELLWFLSLGVDLENLRIRQHRKDELSHYSSDTWDIEYKFPFGWREVEGLADRSDYDLVQHEKFSNKELKVFDIYLKEKFLPKVVCEPSLGVERAFLVFMFDSYFYDKKRENIVLKIHPKLSPIKAAVLPIVRTKKSMIKLSKKIYEELREEFNVSYDEKGSIGRRYSRNDEIGTPFCITIDEQGMKEKYVTFRIRDTTEQIKVGFGQILNVLREGIAGKNILEMGEKIYTRKK
ncbi:MAG: glycine--tRNA ligase [Candidatus Pacearchaeota archaeon]